MMKGVMYTIYGESAHPALIDTGGTMGALFFIAENFPEILKSNICERCGFCTVLFADKLQQIDQFFPAIGV